MNAVNSKEKILATKCAKRVLLSSKKIQSSTEFETITKLLLVPK